MKIKSLETAGQRVPPSLHVLQTYLEKTMGQGWWDSKNYVGYYEQLEGDSNPFKRGQAK